MNLSSSAVLTVDLHGRNEYQARICINSALRKAGNGVYRVRLIHGSNNGTVLRSMIEKEYSSCPGVLRLVRINDGTTDLVLREL